MEPTILVGTKLLVDRNLTDLKPGHIICFWSDSPDTLVVHRLIGKFSILRRKFFVQTSEGGAEASCIPDMRMVGIVRSFDNQNKQENTDFFRPLRMSEKRLFIKTTFSFLSCAIANRLKRTRKGKDELLQRS